MEEILDNDQKKWTVRALILRTLGPNYHITPEEEYGESDDPNDESDAIEIDDEYERTEYSGFFFRKEVKVMKPWKVHVGDVKVTETGVEWVRVVEEKAYDDLKRMAQELGAKTLYKAWADAGIREYDAAPKKPMKKRKLVETTEMRPRYEHIGDDQ